MRRRFRDVRRGIAAPPTASMCDWPSAWGLRPCSVGEQVRLSELRAGTADSPICWLQVGSGARWESSTSRHAWRDLRTRQALNGPSFDTAVLRGVASGRFARGTRACCLPRPSLRPALATHVGPSRPSYLPLRLQVGPRARRLGSTGREAWRDLRTRQALNGPSFDTAVLRGVASGRFAPENPCVLPSAPVSASCLGDPRGAVVSI